jgi:microcystin-dependent protein
VSESFIGEIRMAGFNFAPIGWAFCDGSLQAISQNEALFALIGTTYGGDAVQTFGLPDLQGRIPIHQGTGPGLSNYVLGQKAGTEAVTLTAQQLPFHSHTLVIGTDGTRSSTAVNTRLGSGEADIYTHGASAPVNLLASQIGMAGSSLAHANVQPSLVVNFIISLFGIFPSQN